MLQREGVLPRLRGARGSIVVGVGGGGRRRRHHPQRRADGEIRAYREVKAVDPPLLSSAYATTGRGRRILGDRHDVLF